MGTRWNPTQEQIKILESLYKSGMRTPNAQQIERITKELVEHGRIEGKNVFYWFQNHKARERQKHKRRAALSVAVSYSIPSTNTSIFSDIKGPEERGKESIDGRCKRRCRSWEVEFEFDDCRVDGRTLELFPLHPGSTRICDH